LQEDLIAKVCAVREKDGMADTSWTFYETKNTWDGPFGVALIAPLAKSRLRCSGFIEISLLPSNDSYPQEPSLCIAKWTYHHCDWSRSELNDARIVCNFFFKGLVDRQKLSFCLTVRSGMIENRHSYFRFPIEAEIACTGLEP